VRKIYVLSLALLVAAMMALPANAAMWVGGEIGANFIPSTSVTASGTGTITNTNIPAFFGLKYKDVAFQPAVMGGLTVGYDFVNAGFAGYAWPDWMKYFGFIVDFTYNRVAIRNQFLPISGVVTAGGGIGNITSALFPHANGYLFSATGATSNGSIPCLAFLFYGHYGFFPDSEITIGRVHPYLGVGPAIAWTNLDLGPYGLGTATSTNIALAVEGGVRFILLPNVTCDLGFRYRYLQPNWSHGGNLSVPTAFPGVGIHLSPAALKASVDEINSMSVLCRVNYHF
jgi:opacity protein-like surface antigen